MVAFQRRNDNFSAQGSLRKRDRDNAVQIVSLPLEEGMLLHMQHYVEITRRATVQTAFADSEGALVNLDADRRRVALLTDGEVRAARGYRAVKLGYDRGLTDLQTTLSTEQAWRATRSQLTAAEVQAARRTIQVYKSLGGGWPAEHFPSDRQAR